MLAMSKQMPQFIHAENIVWSFGIYCVKYGTVIGSHCEIATLYISKY